MASMNVQGDLRSRLSAALAPIEVRVKVPEKIKGKLVVVSREGGARRNALIDGPGIGIRCWAQTELEAWELAEAVADTMEKLPFSAGYASAEQEAMYSDPDPETGGPCWYLSYSLNTFKPKD